MSSFKSKSSHSHSKSSSHSSHSNKSNSSDRRPSKSSSSSYKKSESTGVERNFKRKYSVPHSESKSANKRPKPEDFSSLRAFRRSQKPNADLISQATDLYKFSLARMAPDQRKAKIDEILTACKGKIADIACKHSSSRVFQLCSKYGSGAQRELIQRELDGRLLNLAGNHYAHFLILKLLQYHSSRSRDQAAKEFTGHFQSLANTADSLKVLDYFFASTKSQKDQHKILCEFYSNDFSHGVECPPLIPLAGGAQSAPAVSNSLFSVLSVANLTRRTQIMENVKQFLSKCATKKLFIFRFVHAIAINYWNNADENQRIAFFNELEGNLLPLTSDSLGCRLMLEFIKVGGAKERKKILKELKPNVIELSQSPDAYFIILAAVHSIDDSVQVNKFLEPLVKEPITIKELAKNPQSIRIFNYLITQPDRWSQALTAFDWQLIQSQPQNSKKDPAAKHFELLVESFLPIFQSVTESPEIMEELIENAASANVIQETFLTAADLIHRAAAAEESKESTAKPIPAALTKQIEKITSQLEIARNNLNQLVNKRPSSILAHVNGHYLMKRLLKCLPKSEFHIIIKNWIELFQSDPTFFISLTNESRSAFVLNQLFIELTNQSDKESLLALKKLNTLIANTKLISQMDEFIKKNDQSSSSASSSKDGKNEKKKKEKKSTATIAAAAAMKDEEKEVDTEIHVAGCKVLLETIKNNGKKPTEKNEKSEKKSKK